MTARLGAARRRLVVAGFTLAATASLAASQGRPQYRTHAMGDTLLATAHLIGQPVTDATSTPAVAGGVQELRWHARHMRGGHPSAGDPVDRLVFGFFEHRLFRVVVDYAPDRTAGMTAGDMVTAVSSIYGQPLRRTLVSAVERRPRAAESVIAEWKNGDEWVTLLATQGQTAYRIIVVSTALETLARASGAREAPVDRPDWPSIDAARARVDLFGAEPLLQKTRQANIASFVP